MPANIAEGFSRYSAADYARFLAIAKGSLMETETFITLATELGYLNSEDAGDALKATDEIDKMLTSLRKRVLA